MISIFDFLDSIAFVVLFSTVHDTLAFRFRLRLLWFFLSPSNL